MSSRSTRSSRREIYRPSRPKKELSEKKGDNYDGKPKLLSSMTSPTSSQPVIIPTRTSTPRRKPTAERTPSNHDNEAMPPSMAALLAIASAHNKLAFSTKREFVEKILQKDTLSPDDFRFTLSSSSPKSWSILQSPPAEEEDDSKECEGDASSMTSGSTAAPLSSFRSMSYDSMPSLDLELDLESPVIFDPPTPAARIRAEQRKLVASRSSIGETDHPLSPPATYEQDLPTPTEEKILELPPPRVPTPKSLKSNLTASIRMLKSAAKTTLSTISPTQYTANPLSSFSGPDVPTPSKSRPETSPVPLVLANIDAIPFHMTSPLPDLPAASMSIQLLPYSPSPVSSSDSATAPPIFLPAAQPSHETMRRKSLTRPREPRENSAFLRVVVLEMNMRRAGKLNSEGRARIWLGARRERQIDEEPEDQTQNQGIRSEHEQRRSNKIVPSRWRDVSL